MAARISHTTPFAALVLLGLLAPSPASATTYAVGPGQQHTSILTLPALTAGDVVEIHPGTYNEARRWSDSGTAASPIIIRGVGTPTPVFDGTGVSVTGSGSVPRALFQIDGDHYRIENLEFTNARNGNNGAGIRVLADDVTVRRAPRRSDVVRPRQCRPKRRAVDFVAARTLSVRRPPAAQAWRHDITTIPACGPNLPRGVRGLCARSELF